MTTATPRVRVMLAEGGFRDGREYRDYAVLCDYHGWIGRARQWSPAMIAAAHRHAVACPAARLAAVLARLEGLRDFYRLPWRVPTEAIADDLDAIIREVTR